MATRNRTLKLLKDEAQEFSKALLVLEGACDADEIVNHIINQKIEDASQYLPHQFVDMLFLDPPYNLNKSFNGSTFYKQGIEAYTEILDGWIKSVLPTLKPNASIYICGDWHTSTSIHLVASKYFTVRNRITWEREKGRGALTNWKNCSEDIWFCTMSGDYYFNNESVKLKRKVIAPYRHDDNSPKDWEDSSDGKFRLTHPSNLWTDITVPFWSMPENTDHPTQKPEKLVAKLMLASTREGGVVFDPFLGSGTAAVVAKKLGRRYVGVEQDREYCCMALKRLMLAEKSGEIQGYSNGVFWERNTLAEQKKDEARKSGSLRHEEQLALLEA